MERRTSRRVGLVLDRKISERVNLHLPDGTTITVLVVDCRPGGCKLGFDAPPSVRIVREELEERE